MSEIKLSELARKYNTDKLELHRFLPEVYDNILQPLKGKINTFVEVGIFYGESVRLWKEYFGCRVVGLEVNWLDKLNIEGVEIIECDQSKEDQLYKVIERIKDCDVILDDGSHNMYDQQKTLAVLFRALKPGGMYIIEDLHTSVWTGNPALAKGSWGDPKKTLTLDMLNQFNVTGRIVSDYMSKEEIEYLESNIAKVDVYVVRPDESITSCIMKKDEKELNYFPS